MTAVAAMVDSMGIRHKVLIVDDKPSNIEILNEILASDYHTFFATNGHDAIRIAQKQQPDLILLDVMMPEPDGHETCLRLKANPETREIPVIFVTAKTSIEDEEKGLEYGAVDYIGKPISPAIVRLRVKNHLELKVQRDLLQSLSTLDGLTGISNRRAFDDFMDKEWRRGMRLKTPLSMVLVDVDRFKNFNDNYGHTAGDECLKKIAHVLGDQVQRSVDMAARYGGEEFACLLPQTDLQGAIQVARKIRQAVIKLQIPHAFSEAAEFVSVSIGAATVIPEESLNPQELINMSDSAMYEAKKKGRNRVVFLQS